MGRTRVALLILVVGACSGPEPDRPSPSYFVSPDVPAAVGVAVAQYAAARLTTEDSPIATEVGVVAWHNAGIAPGCEQWDAECWRGLAVVSELPPSWIATLERSGVALAADSSFALENTLYLLFDSIRVEVPGIRYAATVGSAGWFGGEVSRYDVDCREGACEVVTEKWLAVTDYTIGRGGARVALLREMTIKELLYSNSPN